jgi:hypothetical protein
MMRCAVRSFVGTYVGWYWYVHCKGIWRHAAFGIDWRKDQKFMESAERELWGLRIQGFARKKAKPHMLISLGWGRLQHGITCHSKRGCCIWIVDVTTRKLWCERWGTDRQCLCLCASLTHPSWSAAPTESFDDGEGLWYNEDFEDAPAATTRQQSSSPMKTMWWSSNVVRCVMDPIGCMWSSLFHPFSLSSCGGSTFLLDSNIHGSWWSMILFYSVNGAKKIEKSTWN